MIAFGPVPSRRLGRSLGINNIPPKVCTYSCVYCQLGRTNRMRVERRVFYEPGEIVQAVWDKVETLRQSDDTVDYLSFVPDGEPTLDVHVGREIDQLRPLDMPIAVITNGSLMWSEDVRQDLAKADWVSLKVDAVRSDVWGRVNRPHGGLSLSLIQEGMLAFASEYDGGLMTETMLVEGLNDDEGSLEEVAEFLAELQPATAYLSIPTRPPAEEWVRASDERRVNRAYQILSERLDRVEVLIGYGGGDFTSTGDVREDLLDITAVHPMREGAVREFVARAGAKWPAVQELVDRGELVEVLYEGQTFYVRRFPVVRESREE